MKIECELEIMPKRSPSESVQIIFRVHGEEAFRAYEHDLTECQRYAVGQITRTHARVLDKFGKTQLGITG